MSENDPHPDRLVGQSHAMPPSALPQAVYPGWQIALSFCIGWVFVFVGLLGLLYAPFLNWRTRQFVVHAVHAQAPIVDFKIYPPGRSQSHETYRPIVDVTDASGTSTRVLVGAAAFPSPYQIGRHVEVLYPPGKPAEAVMNNTEDTWGTTIAAAILSPFVLFMGIGTVLWMRFFIKHPPEHLIWLDRWSVPLRLVSRLITG